MVLSIALPPPPPETVFSGGLPFGALEAVKGAYGALVQVIEPPETGFHLTLQLDLTKLSAVEGTLCSARLFSVLDHIACNYVKSCQIVETSNHAVM